MAEFACDGRSAKKLKLAREKLQLELHASGIGSIPNLKAVAAMQQIIYDIPTGTESQSSGCGLPTCLLH